MPQLPPAARPGRDEKEQAMKTLLLLGGMTPDATMLYYKTINDVARGHGGGRTSAPLHIFSADLEVMMRHVGAARWSDLAQAYSDPVAALTRPPGRVDAVVICAVLAHKAAGRLSRALEGSGVPLLHVADMLARHIKARHPHVRTLGLLGPRVTMADAHDADFFIGRLQSTSHGFRVVVPGTPADVDLVDRGIMDEVVRGSAAVTEAIVLASTDLGFVLKQRHVGDGVPLIDPATVHARAVAEWALQA
ncbi:Asp/Glu racemase [Metarhizium album ARSEF 1941]|uniref:Asp/Glu racemase n=1 Tax=Metarhizium album (strain ARSEF 1941) TaxID=1081103 RepID=A0A0B2WQG0_METAS|nr:Asp/Glu racemase [Metarhizium album ARSEF 1941]KHN95225.1 Asp/Glu racemase [Metarhizium album ARSEF 1941]